MALTWSGRRQLYIFAIVAGVLLIFGYIFIIPSKAGPTCFDAKQNGDEEGIDCGGSCYLLCPFQAGNLAVKWARAFPVTDSVYNALAYVENQNPDSGVESISYEFKFYDEKNVFVTSRQGSTFIGPAGRFMVFEPRINAGNRQIKKTFFSFTQNPIWVKLDSRFATFPLSARDIKLSNTESSPKIEASISNDSIYDIRDLDVVAIVYGADQNAITVSKTYLESLAKNSKAQVFFTWPSAFSEKNPRIDIVPILNPFKFNF